MQLLWNTGGERYGMIAKWASLAEFVTIICGTFGFYSYLIIPWKPIKFTLFFLNVKWANPISKFLGSNLISVIFVAFHISSPRK